MYERIKAYADLLRLHFFFVWPILFCAGLFFGLTFSGNFSYTLLLKAVLIAFLGFEAGFVLNDIVDINVDKKELQYDKKLTSYWRPFGNRPLSQGLIPSQNAFAIFVVLVVLTSLVIFTLPYPNSFYVFTTMMICYSLEFFYQIKKRHERTPVAQIVGRVDFALFLVAGYLCVGNPNLTVLALFFFFYPLALVHLGVNDLIDIANDRAKNMYTPSTLYGVTATVYWILAFSLFHFVMATIFLYVLSSYFAIVGFAISFLLIAIVNIRIYKNKTPDSAIKVLPLLHLSMLLYAISIITNYILTSIF